MITIDAHHHFWRYDPLQYSWIDRDMSVLRRDFLAEHLHPLMREAGVDGVVSVEAREDLRENKFLLDNAARRNWILGVVGKTPLAQGERAVREHLEALRPEPKLVGVRDVLQDQPDEAFTDPAFNGGLSVLPEHGLRFDLCIVERQLPAATTLVDLHPDLVFVLDHIAKPRIREASVEPWASQMRALAKRPHVFCKLSGLVTEADRENWTQADLQPYMDAALETFGPDRLMLGSDWPVCRLACTYSRWVAMVREYADDLAPDERTSLLGGTATRAYRLNLEPLNATQG